MASAQPLAAIAEALRTAAEDLRLQLLLHAARSGYVAPGDAHKYRGISHRSGTGQYHIMKLVQAGLLERANRGRYVLTTAGALIARLDEALQGPTSSPEMLDVFVRTPAPQLDRILPKGGELLLDLSRRLPDGASAATRIHVQREAAG